MNTKNKSILQLLQARQKSGTAMAGPAVPPTTALTQNWLPDGTLLYSHLPTFKAAILIYFQNSNLQMERTLPKLLYECLNNSEATIRRQQSAKGETIHWLI